MVRYFIVPSFMCLLFFIGCTNLRNDPAIQDWKDFNTRIMMSDAITGITWEISKLYEIRQDILYTDFITSIRSKKSENELNKILQAISLRSSKISKVISFLKDKGVDKNVIKRYELVLLINKRTLYTTKLLNKVEAGNRIDAFSQKELDSLKNQLTAFKTEIDQIIAKWLKAGQSNPDTLIRKTFPEYFKSSIQAYGSLKFYKTVDSYIEEGEMIIDKIMKIKKNTGRWARKKEIKFNKLAVFN